MTRSVRVLASVALGLLAFSGWIQSESPARADGVHVVKVDATAGSNRLQITATDQPGAYGTATWGTNSPINVPATSITLDCVSVQDVLEPSGAVLYHMVYASGLAGSTTYYISVSDQGGPAAGSISVSNASGSNPCNAGTANAVATGTFLIAP